MASAIGNIRTLTRHLPIAVCDKYGSWEGYLLRFRSALGIVGRVYVSIKSKISDVVSCRSSYQCIRCYTCNLHSRLIIFTYTLLEVLWISATSNTAREAAASGESLTFTVAIIIMIISTTVEITFIFSCPIHITIYTWDMSNDLQAP